MKPSKKILILGTLSVVLLTSVFFRDRLIFLFRSSQVDLARAALEEKDLALLRNPKEAHFEDLHGALIRRSSLLKEDMESRDLVNRFLAHESSKVQAAAAFTLLAWNQKTPELETLLTNKRNIEIETLCSNGLSLHAHPNKIPLIQWFLGLSGLSENARINALSALYQSQRTTNEKKATLQTLITMAQEEKNPKGASLSLSAAATLDPGSKEVLDLLKKALGNSAYQHVHPLIIRHLSARKEQEVIENFAFKLKPGSPEEITIAILETLNLSCPISRWSILQNVFFSDTRKKVRSAVFRSIEQMPGTEAKTFLQRIEKNMKEMTNDEIIILQNTKKKVLESKFPDPCLLE